MSVVELNQVKKYFDGVAAIKELTLNIEEGEVLGLFGHNGAGKTTTMKLILGLLKPSEGVVSVFGHSPASPHFSDYRYRLGFLPENVSFYQQLTGKEVLAYFAKLKKVSKNRVVQLLEEVGLSHAANRKVKTYSKGMKQRLGLAQALLTEPKLLLLDEPTVGLDPIATQDFYTMVDQLKKAGCSVVLCSHVLPGVEKHIDRAAILGAGQLQALGTLAELRQQAELPTIIHAYGEINQDILRSELAEQVTSISSNDSVLEIHTTHSEKTNVLRQVMKHPGCTDIDLHTPSLEQIYRYFVEASTTDSRNNTPPHMTNSIAQKKEGVQ
ncbi:ABC transporter ATP-binding protein [Alkalimarinus sediminis]|uniref:ABC transporter ATP-binding protein n=1 Tax=Alkalimarinus sediminis TaxID=1632866 RepID=A0A9E8KQ78_9ALTE|nr:ABC transporter ATP-binding protein [Alkalimarinus sediminis]UZW74362.1 ABC transporter ATP-binding protein [Alkalimarinus sediminis]